ncbi:MAG TPA: type II secretion system F family protein [Pseudomonas sabulinigri]|uniref:Type II secretion system protein GspF domain-containing protein n=1 Tax=marine sediment metagenome TaxID=412755 RepID=A0A0F9VJF7_9ZZZZ|nr:type II secretion system F family protein [Halopseudomonas sabulinigri]HEC52390.1 type II secretion system F family protein [Halopseudomonas sabulinigri]
MAQQAALKKNPAAAKKKAKEVKFYPFKWEGKDRKGTIITGEIQGSNAALVKNQLRKQGILVTKINKKSTLFSKRAKKIKPLDIAFFTRQLATMMESGVPIIQAFEIIAEGSENPNMAKLVNEVKIDVAAGNTLADSLRQHPQYFDDLFCNLVESGEQSGRLESLLDRIATYKEKTEALKAKIRKAMTYPVSVVIVAIIVTAIMLLKVVPSFQEVFANFGAELPGFTLFVIGLSEWLQAWWFIVLIAIIAGGYVYGRAHVKSKKLRDAEDRALLKAPVVGKIIYEAAVARFARTLSTTFAAGVPLVEALDSVAGASGNVVFYNAVMKIKEDVSAGSQLNFSMRTTNVFPSLAVQMAGIGEESGNLDGMLEKVADYYEAEVDNKVDNLTTLLEPLIMCVLGVLVGGLIIAMYLPIFQLGAVV